MSPSLMVSLDETFGIFAPDSAHQTPPPSSFPQSVAAPTTREVQHHIIAQKDELWDEDESLIDWDNSKPTVLN